jgi:hypothetical protein
MTKDKVMVLLRTIAAACLLVCFTSTNNAFAADPNFGEMWRASSKAGKLRFIAGFLAAIQLFDVAIYEGKLPKEKSATHAAVDAFVQCTLKKPVVTPEQMIVMIDEHLKNNPRDWDLPPSLPVVLAVTANGGPCEARMK